MNKENKEAISRIAKTAKYRILFSILMSIPPLLLTAIFFPYLINKVLTILLVINAFNFGLMIVFIKLNSKLRKEKMEENKVE